MTALAPYHVRFDSSPEHVSAIRMRCEAMAEAMGFDERAVGEIGLCVNEAIANILEHAYRGDEGKPIELWAHPTGEGAEAGLQIRIRDWGPGVDPSKLPVREKDPLVPGGLGLICLREMMDRVEYAPQPHDGGGMLLTLSRKLNSTKKT